MLIPILDGHNDSLHHLYPYGDEQVRKFFMQHTEGHLDLPRARAGGLAGGFFAVFVPSASPGAAPRPMEVSITEDGYEVPLAAPLDQAAALAGSMAMAAGLFRLEAAAQGQGLAARLSCLSSFPFQVKQGRKSCEQPGRSGTRV